MRLLVCGNRTWTDREHIAQVLRAFAISRPSEITLIHGDASGADRIAAEVALSLGWRVVAVPAEWDRHGKAAGALRNQRMIDEGKPTHGIAFGTLRKGQKWTGTGDMVCRLIDAGVPVRCHPRRK